MRGTPVLATLGCLSLLVTAQAMGQLPKGYLHLGYGVSSAHQERADFSTAVPTGAVGVAVGRHEWLEVRLSRMSATHIDSTSFGDEGYYKFGATVYPLDVVIVKEAPPTVAGLRPFLGAGLSLVAITDHQVLCCGAPRRHHAELGAVFAGGGRAGVVGGLVAEVRGGYRLIFDLSTPAGNGITFTGWYFEGGLQWRW